MRLLNIHNLEFQWFRPGTIPRYAAASHRWEEGEGEKREATFQDVKKKQNTSTTGYRKIRDFAGYIRSHMPSIDWLWIDTCCINKQDSQELTEAINSMFKWYRDSAVCLAYLADVQSSTDSGFKASEWFIRGWTLQELLAPRIAVFLSRDWQVIGHKSCDSDTAMDPLLRLGKVLDAIISETTGIPESILRDCQCSAGLTISERLAWMDNRQTTREEDMSYALLGIFDVSMPVIYSEGGEKARRRLLYEISKDSTTLEKLPVAPGAAFDDRENEHVSECLLNTRVNLLREIDGWASSQGGACIFWLGGMAGTGKSTVFKTISQRFQHQHRLAASFCFKRGEADRENASRLITTISAQLAHRLPEVRDRVISALEQDTSVIRKSLKEQFQRLILQPLERFASPPAHGPAWVIGIDALDECDNESDIELVIDLLARLRDLKGANFRLFVTSRPDLPVRLGFSRMRSDAHQDIRLEEIPEEEVAHDIQLYLRHQLAEIRSNYAILHESHALGQNWPGEDAVEALVKMAQPLFIFAATACRLLGEPDEDPNESLNLILEHRLEPSQLDRTYQPVLERLVANKTKGQQERIIKEFHAIVGSIVMLAEPLPIAALSKVLEVSEEKIKGRLQRLYSVLDVPPAEKASKPVRLLHLSFRDYLIEHDTRDKTPFSIEEAQQHRMLAYQCLRLLSRPAVLQEDICCVEKPGTRRMEVDHRRIRGSIGPDVAYACSYWSFHFVKSGEQLLDNSIVHHFLQQHFLHWLEALIWLGRLSSVVAYIHDLLSTTQGEKSSVLSIFLQDSERFVLKNRHIIDLAPLQLYQSALIFAPTQSVVRKTFSKTSDWLLELLSPETSNRSSEFLRFEVHNGAVNAIAFSPDGHAIVSASEDGSIKVCNTATGEEVYALIGHADWVGATAFSPDGLTIASASLDRTIRLWDAKKGSLRSTFEVQDDWINAVQFSPDGRTLASGSRDSTVKLWVASTGLEIRRLQGHNDWIRSLSFSIDGQMLASASRDMTIRIWSTTNGEEMHMLKGHAEWVNAVAFSPVDNFLASASGDKTVRLWSSATGTQTRLFLGHEHWVNDVAFSPNARTIVSASHDHTVRIWDTTTGHQMQIFEGHDQWVNAVAFSPNGQILASASGDTTVRLWDASLRDGPDSHVQEEGIISVVFSPDGQVLASGSSRGSVKLWSVASGRQMLSLAGHSDEVWNLKFSPDGKYLASASTDLTVRLWETTLGKECQKISVNEGLIIEISYVHDQHVIKVITDDSKVRWWNTVTNEFEEDLRHLAHIHGRTCCNDEISAAEVSCSQVSPYIHSKSHVERWYVSDQWIKFGNEEILWLPYEHRGTCFAWHGTTIALGQRSGNVTFLVQASSTGKFSAALGWFDNRESCRSTEG